MDWKLKTIDFGDSQITLELPADPDTILDDAAERDSNHDSDPYWGWLWDASIDMSRMILSEPWSLPLRTLELGCGIGLAGIAGLAAGLDMTLSDLVPDAVDLAKRNAARNGFEDVPGIILDWNRPLDDKFDLVIASDVLYDETNHQPLLNLGETILASNGEFWIGDPGRSIASEFLYTARDAGWSTKLRHCKTGGSEMNSKFQLLVLRRD